MDLFYYDMAHRRGRMLKAEANRIGFLEEGGTFRYEYFIARREHRVYPPPPFTEDEANIQREGVA